MAGVSKQLTALIGLHGMALHGMTRIQDDMQMCSTPEFSGMLMVRFQELSYIAVIGYIYIYRLLYTRMMLNIYSVKPVLASSVQNTDY